MNEEAPRKRGFGFCENEYDLNDLIKIFMFRFVKTKDKWMKMQIFCFKTSISKMATIVRFVQVKTICQYGVYTVDGINYSLAKNKKRKEPYIATQFGKYCTENAFLYELAATLRIPDPVLLNIY